MTTPEDAKAVIRRWNEEGWSGGKYDLAYEIISPDMQVHGAGAELPRVIEWAEQGGFHVTDLSVTEPSLETVFISLTGKDLRE